MKIVDVKLYDADDDRLEMVFKFDNGYYNHLILDNKCADEFIGLKLIQFGNDVLRNYWDDLQRKLKPTKEVKKK